MIAFSTSFSTCTEIKWCLYLYSVQEEVRKYHSLRLVRVVLFCLHGHLDGYILFPLTYRFDISLLCLSVSIQYWNLDLSPASPTKVAVKMCIHQFLSRAVWRYYTVTMVIRVCLLALINDDHARSCCNVNYIEY